MFSIRRITSVKLHERIKNKKLYLRNYSAENPKDDDQIVYEEYVSNVMRKIYTDNDYDYEKDIVNPKRFQLKGSKKPFVKNFFKGIVDTDLLSFPQVYEAEALTSLERNFDLINKYFRDSVDPAEIDRTGNIPDNVWKTMKRLFLFGQKIPTDYKGLNFSNTEYARIMEAVSSRDISLPLIQYTHEILCAKSILKYGTQAQKDAYLPKLAKGEYLATYCLGESETGLEDIFQINTTAIRGVEPGSWCLNGKKMWVINAENSNLYLVVARTLINEQEASASSKDSDTDFFYENRALYSVKEGLPDEFKKYYSNNVTVFIVDKNSSSSNNGITCERDETLGARGLNLCSVTFDNTIVPDANILGKVNGGHEIVVQCPANDRYVFGSVAASAIKSLLSDVTKYAIKTNLGFVKLYERGITQQRIAQMNVHLYAIESMIYMTCGLLDLYDDYDASIESAIVKIFSSEIAWSTIDECMHVYGARSYSKNFPYERYLRDVRCLSLFDLNNDILRLFIASMGLRYIADEKTEVIRKERNPFFYPNHAIKMFWKTRKQTTGEVSYHLKLDKFVHPSLKESSRLVEFCVLRFEYTVHMALSRYGPQIVDKEMVLKRIADCLISLYAMTAVLSRASRAYCIGLRNADVDMQIAETFIRDQHTKFSEVYLGLLEGEYMTTDGFYEKLSDSSVKSFGYCCEHPTKDNF